MIAIYSGTSPARVYEPEPPREQTRQFRSPVFDHDIDELDLRVTLARLHPDSKFATDRLNLLRAVCLFAQPREMLDAFDAENRVKLGMEAL